MQPIEDRRTLLALLDQQTLALDSARRKLAEHLVRHRAYYQQAEQIRDRYEGTIEEQERELKEAREALKKYGEHHYECAAGKWTAAYRRQPTCGCGFAAALSPTKAGTGS